MAFRFNFRLTALVGFGLLAAAAGFSAAGVAAILIAGFVARRRVAFAGGMAQQGNL
jgi:hypothetical protein